MYLWRNTRKSQDIRLLHQADPALTRVMQRGRSMSNLTTIAKMEIMAVVVGTVLTLPKDSHAEEIKVKFGFKKAKIVSAQITSIITYHPHLSPVSFTGYAHQLQTPPLSVSLV